MKTRALTKDDVGLFGYRTSWPKSVQFPVPITEDTVWQSRDDWGSPRTDWVVKKARSQKDIKMEAAHNKALGIPPPAKPEGTNRFDYVVFDYEACKLQAVFKDAFIALEQLVENALLNGRAKSVAITKIEEAYSWIGKAIRDEQIGRNGSAPLQGGKP